MEKKFKAKHHNKHGQHLHRPLDAYQLYELEHMPHRVVRLASDHAKPRAHEAVRPDYYETGREAQPYWPSPGDGDGGIYRPDCYETGRETQPYLRSPRNGNGGMFRPDYYETAQPYWRPTEGDEGGIPMQNIDAEAENFIELEHDRFELSKWMSTKTE